MKDEIAKLFKSKTKTCIEDDKTRQPAERHVTTVKTFV